MSSPSSPTFPFLPTEVKKEILKFCDQPTLAKTSTLSLAFLQLSSPLLYRHVVIEGPEPLKKFLSLIASIISYLSHLEESQTDAWTVDEDSRCELTEADLLSPPSSPLHALQAEKRHPELEPFLSLDLVISVNYIEDEDDFVYERYDPGEEDDSRGFVPLRLNLLESSRLPLTCLRVDLCDSESDLLIFDFFNPAIFELQGQICPPDRVSLLCLSDIWDGWTRLREVSFYDAFLRELLLDHSFPSSIGHGELSVLYNLSTTEQEAECLDWLVEDLSSRDGNVPLIKEVHVVLSSEELKRVVLERLAGFPLLPRISISVRSNGSTSVPLQATQPTIPQTAIDN